MKYELTEMDKRIMAAVDAGYGVSPIATFKQHPANIPGLCDMVKSRFGHVIDDIFHIGKVEICIKWRKDCRENLPEMKRCHAAMVSYSTF